MKATLVREIGAGFVAEEVQLAAPIGREVLVDVKASGLCHTDLTASRNNIGYEPPMVLGHEVAGVVSAVGPDVTEFAPGDHVVGCLVQSCGHCEACLTDARSSASTRRRPSARRPTLPGSRMPRVSRSRRPSASAASRSRPSSTRTSS